MDFLKGGVSLDTKEWRRHSTFYSITMQLALSSTQASKHFYTTCLQKLHCDAQHYLARWQKDKKSHQEWLLDLFSGFNGISRIICFCRWCMSNDLSDDCRWVLHLHWLLEFLIVSKLSLHADLGIPWSPSEASRLSTICSFSTDQHQPGSAFPIWTRKPGAAFRGRPCTSRTSSWYGFRINSTRWDYSNFKLNPGIRLWFKKMYGSKKRSMYPGSWNPKKAVPAGATASNKLTDTKKT